MLLYIKINKYIITLEYTKNKIAIINNMFQYNNENFYKIVEIEDFTNNQKLNEIINFKVDDIINIESKLFNTREQAFYYNFIKNQEYLFFENGYSGIHKTYNDKGELLNEFFHINGKINGLYTEYLEKNIIKENLFVNNRLIEEKIFKKKKLISYFIYTDTGKIFERYYDNGKMHEKGKCINFKFIEDYYQYYENGILNVHKYYLDGVLNGKYKEYFKNGKLYIESNYTNNRLNGERREYFESGNLKSISYYKNNKLNGEYIQYFDVINNKELNKLYIKKKYIDGCLDGTFEEYHDNGNIHIICNYKYDKTSELQLMGKKYVSIIKCEKNKHGDIIQFYKSGNIYKTGKYVNNNLEGEYIIYAENGDIIKKMNYKCNVYVKN
jgi:antitoxin component YwqK of YwqJK toxin-antitoxin module